MINATIYESKKSISPSKRTGGAKNLQVILDKKFKKSRSDIGKDMQNGNSKQNGIEKSDQPIQDEKGQKKIGKITDFIFNKDTHLLGGVTYDNTKYTEFLYGKLMMNSFIQVVFALLSILSGFIQYEIQYSDSKYREKAALAAEWICFITSIGLWSTFVYDYLLDCELNFYLKKLPERLWRADPGKIWDLLTNFIIFIFHPNPVFHEIDFTIYNTKFEANQSLYVNDIMFSLLLMRLWFIFKLLVVFSEYSSARTQRVCRMNNFSVNFSFCMKSLMQNTPYHVFGLLLLLCIIFCSCNLRVYERGLDDVSQMNFSNYWNSIWCIIITMTTVGFGDYYPSSIIGRIIGIISCFNGVFLISMLVATITNVLNLSSHEQNVYMILEKVNLESEKLDVAKSLIAKYFNIIRKAKKEDAKSFEADKKVMGKMKYDFLFQYNLFKEKITEIESTYPPYSNFDALNENLSYLETEFQAVEARQNQIKDLINKVYTKLNINDE